MAEQHPIAGPGGGGGGPQAAGGDGGSAPPAAAAAAPTADAKVLVRSGSDGGSSSGGDGKGGAGGSRSIFDLYSRRQKAAILLVCAAGMLMVPVSDTIYLPALALVQRDLQTSATMVAASVSLYMFTVGLGGLAFGPTADRFGRRVTLTGSTALFICLSVACIFAPNIQVLLAFRALQGFVVSSCSTTSNAILADIFAPQERGRAMGIASIPFLVGPVAGPLVGGGLAQAFGWRSTYVALAVLGALVLAAQLLVIRQETHHWFALQRLRATEGTEAAAAVREEAHPPRFDPPYAPLLHLADRHIWPHALVTVLQFSTMFAALIILPIVFSGPPYFMAEGLIGVANGVPFGVGGLLAAPLGGLMADRCAARWGASPAGRMVYASVVALCVFPAAALLFGWGMHFKLPAPVPLVGGFFINAAMTSSMPACMSLISIWKQRYAAAAGGGLFALQFVMAAVFIQVTPPGIRTLGVGPFMSLLVGIDLAAILYSLWVTVTSIRHGEAAPTASRKGSAVGGPAAAAAEAALAAEAGAPGA